MDEKIEQKDSKRLTLMYIAIVFSVAVLALLAVNYFVEPEEIPEGSFLNPLPDEVINEEIIAELDRTIEFIGGSPEVVEPKIKHENDEYIVKELLEKDLPELTETQLAIKMPQSVLDMSIFLTSYPEVTHEDLNILMAYAVGVERDLLQPKIDAEARIIMEKLLQ